MPPKADADDKQPAALSAEVADLLQKKILEFEQSHAEESEKTQKAQKGKARAAAKNKTKEAKQVLNSSELSDTDKVQKLLEKLKLEHGDAENLVAQAWKRQHEVGATEKERNGRQAELQQTLNKGNKLESLCRQLKQQTKALVDEQRRLTDSERARRQELADEFQQTIGDVKKTMDTQAQERARLARENEELRSRFKQFFEQYDQREKELLEQQKDRDVEVQAFEKKLGEQTQLYRQEATREAAAKRENDELVSTEGVLRGQLQTYSNKFNDFQGALSKSDKVLGQYKRQRNKMQRRLEVLEKENRDLRSRNEKRVAGVTKVLKEKDSMQERCKALRAEQQKLKEDVERIENESSN